MLKKVFVEGFTLVELSLSMLFIGILSISIVLIINNTVSAYRRGLNLSQINTVGSELVDDMRAAVQNSSVRTLRGSCALFYSGTSAENCSNDDAYGLVMVKKLSDVMINGRMVNDVPIYGAFCTGTYSYIWNSGYFDSDNAEFQEKNDMSWAKLVYKTGGRDIDGNDIVREISSSVNDSERPFRLLKVEDSSRAICVAAMDNGSNSSIVYDSNKKTEMRNIIDISHIGSGVISNEPEDVLVADNSNNLAIYDLGAAQPVEGPSGASAFYSVSFILGTINGGINVKAQGNACATPSDYENENFDYCAINKFNFAVQVNGG